MFEPGKLTAHKSRFQEEFPELAAGGADDRAQKKEDESKELQYGPGPSLRPQSKTAFTQFQQIDSFGWNSVYYYINSCYMTKIETYC